MRCECAGTLVQLYSTQREKFQSKSADQVIKKAADMSGNGMELGVRQSLRA